MQHHERFKHEAKLQWAIKQPPGDAACKELWQDGFLGGAAHGYGKGRAENSTLRKLAGELINAVDLHDSNSMQEIVEQIRTVVAKFAAGEELI